MSSNINNENILTYSIGQVAAHTELPQSVLRYWETVFPRLEPMKSPGGSRQYSDSDIAIIQRIKELLYENGFTIKGANLQLEKDAALMNREDTGNNSVHERFDPASPGAIPDAQALREQLKRIIRILEED